MNHPHNDYDEKKASFASQALQDLLALAIGLVLGLAFCSGWMV